LLVDDNKSNLKSGREVLKEKYNVITAPSSEKMFNLLDSNSPDLILLRADMQKPEQDIPVILIPEPFNATELIACIERELQT
jgi:response regulator RpfG family c-di-GMP phosphodiesterase